MIHFIEGIPNNNNNNNRNDDNIENDTSNEQQPITTKNKNITHVNKGYWRDKQHQERYLRWLEQQLQVQNIEDWYRVKVSDVRRVGGGSLLACYGGSLLRVLQALYPHHHWHPWLFTAVAPGFWNSKTHQKEFLDWLSKELDIEQPSDWYQVKLEQVKVCRTSSDNVF